MLLLALTAHADPMIDALQAELERSRELSLPDAPTPYFIAYQLDEGRRVGARAVLGGMHGIPRVAADRALKVMVRVGSPELDNGNFNDRYKDQGAERRRLGEEASITATVRDAWLLTDDAYKDAVENLARKESAYRGLIVERPADFAPAEQGVVHDIEVPEVEFDVDGIAELCRTISSVFRAHPQIEWSEASCHVSSGRTVLLDTTGTRVVGPNGQAQVSIQAGSRAEDGQRVGHRVDVIRTTYEQLPSEQELTELAEGLAADVEAWRAASVPEDGYAGPVLFEGDAAAELFQALLVPAVLGTPPEQKKSWSGKLEADGAMARLKRRLLPPGFAAVDDPLADPELPSSFTHDLEGVPAQRVELIRQGLLVDHLMTRVPNHDLSESNGHARHIEDLTPRAGISNLTITADKVLSRKKMDKLARQLAAPYDLDYILVVRSILDPRVAGWQRASLYRMVDDVTQKLPTLKPPFEVVRRYFDGREEQVRGLEFVNVDRRALRDIAAAGASRTRTLRSRSGPVTITAPDVLLTEVELAVVDEIVEELPPLPSPLLR